MKRKLLTLFCATFMLFAISATGVSAASLETVNNLEKDYKAAINNTFTWAKMGESTIFNKTYLATANGTVGSTFGDWTAFGVGRSFYSDNWQGYLDALEKYVSGEYSKNGGLLDRNKSTEWHRVIFAITALDGDPTAFGTYNGKKINLVADGIYNCKIGTTKNGIFTPNIVNQGVNGAIFGLLALDSKQFVVPSNADYDRNDLIKLILDREIKVSDSLSGFALDTTKGIPDADLTGMALQALAPYYKTNADVKAVVDRSLAWLSATQKADGSFGSYGSSNTESTSQVLMALCSLGVDPTKDERFIKNGQSVVESLNVFYLPAKGGFAHSMIKDDLSPDSTPGEVNSMATDQARMALIAYSRFVNNETAIYNCSDIPAHKIIFNDVPRGSWYYMSIYDLVNKNILNGKENNNFDPEGKVTRAEFAKILAETSKQDYKNYSNKFTDTSNHWAKDYISWANAKGIVEGTGDSKFSPEEKISRQDMAVMIARYCQKISGTTLPVKNAANVFSDNDKIAGYAKDAVSAMQKAGIINGKENNNFDPVGDATRGEAAKMISYFLKLI